MSSPQRPSRLLRFAALAVVVVLTALAVVYRAKITSFSQYGYAGIFLISLVTNATLFLPLPGVLFTSAMGYVFNPYGVALAAGSGATLGEITGYLAGFSGQGVIQNQVWYRRMEGWMQRYGGPAILLLAFVPNPLFDMTGIIAGGLRMPLSRFLLWTWIGKTLKMLAFALSGGALLDLIPWWQ